MSGRDIQRLLALVDQGDVLTAESAVSSAYQSIYLRISPVCSEVEFHKHRPG